MKYHPKEHLISDSMIKRHFNKANLFKLKSEFRDRFTKGKDTMTAAQANKYFDRAFKSNVLWGLSMNGMDITPANIKTIMGKGFINNATAFNKRSQIWMTDSFSGQKDFYTDKISDMSKQGNFRYMIVKDLKDIDAKLDHRDISLDSIQNPEHVDGAILARRDVLTANNKDAGTASDATQNKSFYYIS